MHDVDKFVTRGVARNSFELFFVEFVPNCVKNPPSNYSLEDLTDCWR